MNKDELPESIYTWPKELYLNVCEDGDLPAMQECETEEVRWSSTPALGVTVKYIRADHCDGIGHVPMPEIPHIQRIEETEE